MDQNKCKELITREKSCSYHRRHFSDGGHCFVNALTSRLTPRVCCGGGSPSSVAAVYDRRPNASRLFRFSKISLPCHRPHFRTKKLPVKSASIFRLPA
jgi:hypothetical protein